LLIERINVYLGRPVISRLVLVQGPLPLPASPGPSPPPPLAAKDAQAIERQLAAIADPELRAALIRLGKNVASGSPRRR
jgi:hypothetical protein